MFLRNAGNHLQNHMELWPRRPESTLWMPWKPQSVYKVSSADALRRQQSSSVVIEIMQQHWCCRISWRDGLEKIKPSKKTLTTSYKEKNHSWISDCHSAIQKIPRRLWIPKDRYHFHKNPSSCRIVSWMNPFHSLPPQFLKIHFNNILSFNYA
jgi:hypothetical protein